MDTSSFAHALVKRWRITVSGLLLGVLVAMGALLMSDTVYKSSAQLFLMTPGWGGPTTLGNSDSSPFQGDEFSQQRAQSYIRLVQGVDFSNRVAQRMGGEVSPDEVAAHLDARVVPDTVLIEITAGSTSPETARDIAAASADELTSNIRTLETPAGITVPTVQPTTVGQAGVPSSPSSPRYALTLLVGATVGLLLGASAAVVRMRSVRTVDDAEAVAAVVGAPVLGAVPAPEDAESDTRFDELRYNLEFLGPRFASGTLTVVSSASGDGRTSVVSGLARAYARAGRSVVTVDADLRAGDTDGRVLGLSNVVAGDVSLEKVVAVDRRTSVASLASGVVPAEPAALLESARLGDVFARLADIYDVVLVDTPDLGTYDDARTLARVTDATLVAVATGSTAQTDLHDAIASLETVGVDPAGAVLTRATTTGSRFGYLAGVRGDEPASRPDGDPDDTAPASVHTETVTR